MATQQMWVCTPRAGVWIRCPDTPLSAETEGRSVETRLLNGGSYVARSGGSRRKYELSWTSTVAETTKIRSLYDGVYGKGPFYLVDPSVAANVLTPHWAAPSLSTGSEWPTLLKGITPVIADTTISSTYTPPPYMATYALPTTAPTLTTTTPRLLIPIPPGFNLNLRAWGAVTGTGVLRINRYNRTTGALTTQDVTPTSTGATITALSGTTYSHVELWLTKTSSAVSTITLASMIAFISLATTAATTWSPGDGQSGLQFVGAMPVTTYRAWGAGYRMVSATMVEVGSWLQ